MPVNKWMRSVFDAQQNVLERPWVLFKIHTSDRLFTASSFKFHQHVWWWSQRQWCALISNPSSLTPLTSCVHGTHLHLAARWWGGRKISWDELIFIGQRLVKCEWNRSSLIFRSFCLFIWCEYENVCGGSDHLWCRWGGRLLFNDGEQQPGVFCCGPITGT